MEDDEHGGRQPDADLEPSLGDRPCAGLLEGDQNAGFSQAGWGNGATGDLEGDEP